MQLATLPNGSRGFDCNVVLSPSDIKKFKEFKAPGSGDKFKYVVRYVPRVVQGPTDLTKVELQAIITGGLGIQIVQHVPLPGWIPSLQRGISYGQKAVISARDCGYPEGASLWCDLEEVKLGTPKTEIIAYCNAWFTEVAKAGYKPGLYLGFQSGLTGYEAYWKLKFSRFWAAYNLNADQFPVERGVCMRQYPNP